MEREDGGSVLIISSVTRKSTVGHVEILAVGDRSRVTGDWCWVLGEGLDFVVRWRIDHEFGSGLLGDTRRCS
jgi:hypothetical protein